MQNTSEKVGVYPSAMVNITNRCTLKCKHCFVFREDNPNEPSNEMDTETMLRKLRELRDRHSIHRMMWMGGEPLLRPDVLREGVKLFNRNYITTNGTVDLIDLPGHCVYVISIDGPPAINDAIRGKGSFDKILKTISRVPPPEEFGPTVMCQCAVTRLNEDYLEELLEIVLSTRLEAMTFSFYVPRANDQSELTWGTLERRDKAVREAMSLKDKHPEFIWNTQRTFELTLSENAKSVTDNCPVKKYMLPIYLDGNSFVHPFCCYGNDVDCDLCGSYAVFRRAEKAEEALDKSD